MLKNIKYFSIDCETSGLDPNTCQILQFSAIYEDPKLCLPFDKIPKFNRFIKHENYYGQDYALWLNSEILLRLSKYKNSWTDEEKEKSEIVTSYKDLLDDFERFVRFNTNEFGNANVYINAAGKNFGTFDLQFINNAIKTFSTPEEYKIKFRHKIIDPAILYVDDDDKSLPGLDKCLQRASITRETHKDGGIVSHDGLMDAFDVIELLRKKY